MDCSDGIAKLYPVERLPEGKIVDTNGAGDAFVGGKIFGVQSVLNEMPGCWAPPFRFWIFNFVAGFLAQLIQGKDIDACVKCAIWSATHVIQQSGCAFDSDLQYQD